MNEQIVSRGNEDPAEMHGDESPLSAAQPQPQQAVDGGQEAQAAPPDARIAEAEAKQLDTATRHPALWLASGICSIVAALVSPIIGIILASIAIVMGGWGAKAVSAQGSVRSKLAAARVLGIIGMVASVVVWTASAVFTRLVN